LDRREKELAVAELREKLERATVAMLTDYRGLKVAEITELREKLKEAGVEYRVVKNTLARLAARDTAASALAEHLSGPCALALGYDDELIPAKLLLDFAKKNDKLEVKAGIMAGRVLLQEDIKKVTGLPSRPELQAQLLGTLAMVPRKLLGVMHAVPADFVSLLAATPRNLLGVLKAIEQKAGQAS
jgi:large subunit ribosomal protein L10